MRESPCTLLISTLFCTTKFLLNSSHFARVYNPTQTLNTHFTRLPRPAWIASIFHFLPLYFVKSKFYSPRFPRVHNPTQKLNTLHSSASPPPVQILPIVCTKGIILPLKIHQIKIICLLLFPKLWAKKSQSFPSHIFLRGQ